MKKQKELSVLELVAHNHGITAEEVTAEIEKAIAIAFYSAQKDGNEAALTHWKALTQTKKIPTAEEFIRYVQQLYRKTYGAE